MDLQELIARGRFIFQGAPERLRLFSLVDGRKTPKEIGRKTKRHVNNVHRDLRRLADLGLIAERRKDGKILKKDGYTLYEKTPLARTVPISYFTGPTKISRPKGLGGLERNKKKRPPTLIFAIGERNSRYVQERGGPNVRI